MEPKKISRREFIRSAGIGAALLVGGNFMPLGLRPSLDKRGYGSGSMAPALQMTDEPFMPDAEVSITASEKFVQILSGAQTRVWSYEGQLLSGSGVTVTNLPGIYLGPIIRAKSGTKVRIFFHNNLAEDSVIHPHGLRVPE